MTNCFLRFRTPDHKHVYEERPGTIADPEHVKPGQVITIENGTKWRVKYVERREAMLNPSGFTPFLTLDPMPN